MLEPQTHDGVSHETTAGWRPWRLDRSATRFTRWPRTTFLWRETAP